MTTNDLQTNILNGYFACFSLVSRYFYFLCYFFVSRFLVYSDGFVIFAPSVKLTKKGRHGTYKEIRVCSRPNPFQGIGKWEQVHLP